MVPPYDPGKFPNRWLLVVVLAVVLVGMLLRAALPALTLIGLVVAAAYVVPVEPTLFIAPTMPDISISRLVTIAIFAAIAILMIFTKIKDERRLQIIRNRKAGDALPD